MSDELITSKVLEETTSYYFGCTKCGLSNTVTILPEKNLRKCDWCGERFDITDKSVVSHGYSGFSGMSFTNTGLSGFSGFSAFQGRLNDTWASSGFSGSSGNGRQQRIAERRERRKNNLSSFMKRLFRK